MNQLSIFQPPQVNNDESFEKVPYLLEPCNNDSFSLCDKDSFIRIKIGKLEPLS